MSQALLYLGFDLDFQQSRLDKILDNLKILQEKKANYGEDCPTLTLKEIQGQTKTAMELVAATRRYLYKLQEQQAEMGRSTPPEILITIEDTKEWLLRNKEAVIQLTS